LTNTGGWSATMEGSALNSALSPDGRQVAYAWSNAKPRRSEVRVLPIEGESEPRVLPQRTDLHYLEIAAWTPDSRQLLIIHMFEDRTSLLALLSLEDGTLRELRSLGHYYPHKVSLSPDGRFVAFDVGERDGALSRDIVVIAADGNGETRVLPGIADDSGPLWSPDGSQLIFASYRTGARSLWMLPMKGREPAGPPRLIRPEIGRYAPLGITRQSTLYYFAEGTRRNVRTATLDDGLKVTGPSASASERFADRTAAASWSPDGRTLAYFHVQGDEVGSMLLVVRSAGTNEGRVVPVQLRTGNSEGSGPPRWFPDGKSVLIAGRDQDSTAARTGYYRVDIVTGRAELLHHNPAIDHLARNPLLSPDGRVLYYCENQDLFRFDLHRRTTTNLRSWLGTKTIRSPVLSPDGSQMAYLSLEGRSAAAEVMPSSGGPPREVTRLTPWFGVSTFSALGWSADGRHLFYVWSARGEFSETELYRVAVAGGQAEKVGVSLNGRLHDPQVDSSGRRLTYWTQEQAANRILAFDGFLPPVR
jgi:Tol biopolymer transport system component